MSASGFESINEMNEEELLEARIQAACDSLFKTAPFKFIPRKNKQLDLEIHRQVKFCNITIPIVFISGNLYLIGSNRCNCELRGDVPMIRVGGGYQRFEDYIPKNHK